jgi:hypothetical protein
MAAIFSGDWLREQEGKKGGDYEEMKFAVIPASRSIQMDR